MGEDGDGSQPDVESDACLVERMVRGDRAALGSLYERHAPKVLGVVALILTDRNEAEDVVHDVFLEAWRRADSFDRSRGSVATWLMVRARSRAADRQRSAARVHAQRELLRSERSAASNIVRPPEAEALHAVLDQVPQSNREVIELSFFEGLTCAEIAAELVLPIGTVKSRMRRGLTILRQALGLEVRET